MMSKRHDAEPDQGARSAASTSVADLGGQDGSYEGKPAAKSIGGQGLQPNVFVFEEQALDSRFQLSEPVRDPAREEDNFFGKTVPQEPDFDSASSPLPGTAMTLQERAYTSPIWYTPAR